MKNSTTASFVKQRYTVQSVNKLKIQCPEKFDQKHPLIRVFLSILQSRILTGLVKCAIISGKNFLEETEMNLGLDVRELMAIRAAEQAVRVLPESPCLHPFPFLGLIDLRSEEADNHRVETYVVSFQAEMRTGCFSLLNVDESSWPKFSFHIVYEANSSYRIKHAQVEFKVSENELRQIRFTVTGDEEGQVIIKAKKKSA